MLKVVAITATSGRHRCMERSLRFFLNQQYPACRQLIFQNSEIPLALDPELDPAKIILVNQHLDSRTGQPYKTLGAIYSDAILHVPPGTDVVCFWDDDDIFFPNHISAGIAGLEKCGRIAYKPLISFFRNGDCVVHPVQNNMEPSVFVRLEHVKKYGFSDSTTDQHLQWYYPLAGGDLFTDPEGVPTMCYNWGDNWPTYKTSGGHTGEPGNFEGYRSESKDFGDGVLTPMSQEEASEYYALFALPLNAHPAQL